MVLVHDLVAFGQRCFAQLDFVPLQVAQHQIEQPTGCDRHRCLIADAVDADELLFLHTQGRTCRAVVDKEGLRNLQRVVQALDVKFAQRVAEMIGHGLPWAARCQVMIPCSSITALADLLDHFHRHKSAHLSLVGQIITLLWT